MLLKKQTRARQTGCKTGLPSFREKKELLIIIVILVTLNCLQFLSTNLLYAFSFEPTKFVAGEWWRIITHPFVHVSMYHFLIDASAFFILYQYLLEESLLKRLNYCLICVLGSLCAAVLFDPQIYHIGYCGLSGLDHGLMVICALEYTCSQKYKSGGFFILCVVLAKSLIEAMTGQVIFSSAHLGDVGRPIAVCHLGGAIGGLVAFYLLRYLNSFKRAFETFIKQTINKGDLKHEKTEDNYTYYGLACSYDTSCSPRICTVSRTENVSSG